MKKWMTGLTVVGLILGFASCKNDSEPVIYGEGAYFPLGNYIENYDGTKYALTESYWPELMKSRYYIEFTATVPEGSPRGPEEIVEASGIGSGTLLYDPHSVSMSSADYDDPVMLTKAAIEQTNREPVTSTVNFLVLTLPLPHYSENGGTTPPEFHFQELGILPGEDNKNDTIDLRLFFDSNRTEGEPSDGMWPCRLALDLQSLNVSSEDKAYILKVNLKTYLYPEDNEPDDDETEMVYLLGKWNPTKPYILP
jgi:hypothetical protein